MAPTVPLCFAGNAGGTAIQDYMTAFHARLAAAPGNFIIENVVGGGTPTSYTLKYSDGWQINHRVSAGEIKSLIAPAGGIINSAAPGTPTNAYPEDTLIPAPSGTGTRFQFAQYSDAFFFAANVAANTHSAFAVHQGRVLNRNNAVDPLNGLGTFAYLPTQQAASSAFEWFSIQATPSNRKSYLRVGTAVWGNVSIPRSLFSVITQTDERIGMVPLIAPDSGTPNAAASQTRGAARYLGEDSTTAAGMPLTVVPSTDSNQGWLRINSANSSTRLTILWDKTVTP